MKRVAIQGGPGAYHEIAAREYFIDEELEIVPCATFRDIFIESAKDPSLVAVMAIENTIAGGLLPNHDLLKLNNLLTTKFLHHGRNGYLLAGGT